jgi:O-antigen/teichoic acid export membrane protein
VGIYRAAKTLSALPARAAGPVWAAVRPRLLRAIHERQQARLRRLIMLPAAAMLAAAVVALPFALLWGEALVSRVYGPGFADATRPLLLLLAGTWTFGAITAWFPFWVIITERRADGARTYSLLFALTVGTALAFGHRSAAYMALAVGSSLVVSAAVAWGAFLRATSAPRSVAPVAEAEAGRAG